MRLTTAVLARWVRCTRWAEAEAEVFHDRVSDDRLWAAWFLCLHGLRRGELGEGRGQGYDRRAPPAGFEPATIG